ncbi:MAG: FkbM family methyltransferase [Deltaproteobacteria bacterium]|nr:FkbM family methyltransferase [Deltaproteobacteria bacterium]
MGIKQELRKAFRRVGYDVCRFTPETYPLARRKQLLKSYSIDVVFDIGANSGQYAQQLRDLGYANRIISFEPLSSAFGLLNEKAGSDPNWEIFNIALGDTEGKQEINIAGNSYSSSLLDMLPSHLASAPESKYIGKQTIEIKRLDSIFGGLCKTTDRVYMKIDTQGYESKVLKGAEKSLMQIDTIQMEMSLIPLYEDETLLPEMCMSMRKKGYSLVAIETGFSDLNSGQLLQVDGIFHRF